MKNIPARFTFTLLSMEDHKTWYPTRKSDGVAGVTILHRYVSSISASPLVVALTGAFLSFYRMAVKSCDIQTRW